MTSSRVRPPVRRATICLVTVRTISARPAWSLPIVSACLRRLASRRFNAALSAPARSAAARALRAFARRCSARSRSARRAFAFFCRTLGVMSFLSVRSTRRSSWASSSRILTRAILNAYASDLNERALRQGRPANPEVSFDVHEFQLPPGADDDPSGDPAPEMEPSAIYEDANVRVTATLVDHRPCFPAFGFRFETPDGVIAFSGDTRPTGNVVRLAHDADILVHEVISRPAMERLMPEPGGPAAGRRDRGLPHDGRRRGPNRLSCQREETRTESCLAGHCGRRRLRGGAADVHR